MTGREVLAARWPALLARVEALRPPGAVEALATPSPTLRVAGIQLASGIEPEEEARLQAELVPADSRTAWVYGVGLGHLPRALLARPALTRLHVVVLHAGLFGLVLDRGELAWLADPRVALHDGETLAEIATPFCAVPSCLRLAADGAARLRDLVVLELATPFINSRFADDASVQARLAENRPFLEADGDVRRLFGPAPRRGDGRIFVAGAGPTLADGFPLLRARGDAPLLAVDAALAPLLAAGIRPAAVLAADPAAAIEAFFAGDLAPLAAVPLVYFPDVAPAVLGRWPGPRLCAYGAGVPHHAALGRTHPRGCLFAAGSVLHPAVDLAVRMGAREVVLLGADFAFPRRLSHVAGSPACRPIDEQAPHIVWVRDGHGGRVPTVPNLRGFLRDLERYVRAHPGVRFVAGSRDGARIEGTSYVAREAAA